MTTPAQYGGGQAGPDGPTRPVNPPGGYPQHGPGGTQYGPPAGGGYPGQGGGYPPPGPSGGWPQPGGGWPPPGPGPGGYPPFQPPGGRPPGSSKTGLIIGIVVAVVVLLGGGTTWFLLSGSGADDKKTATPVAAGPGSPSSAAPAAPTSAAPVETGDVNSVDVEVGECVSLGGTSFDATAEEAPCGSDGPTFIVTAKTETSDECSPDSDQWFYETRNGVQQGALCLDIDWVQGDCFDLAAELPSRVACSSPGVDTVRVGETIEDTLDDSSCRSGSYTYDNRRIVVCLEQV